MMPQCSILCVKLYTLESRVVAVRLARGAGRTAGTSVYQDLYVSEPEVVVTEASVYPRGNEVVDPFDSFLLSIGMIQKVVHADFDDAVSAGVLIQTYGFLSIEAAVVHACDSVTQENIVGSLE